MSSCGGVDSKLPGGKINFLQNAVALLGSLNRVVELEGTSYMAVYGIHSEIQNATGGINVFVQG